MQDALVKFWPCIVVLACLWAGLALVLITSVEQNDGRLIYALDDAYIHMAVAKNLCEHGVWGVTPRQFTSSASSLAWPALLAALRMSVGLCNKAPLWLNTFLASLLVLVGYRLLRPIPRKLGSCLALGAVVLLTPVPALVFSGMEHLLQIVSVVGIALGLVAVTTSPRPSRRSVFSLLALIGTATLIRYEGLFAASAAAGILALRRRPTLAIAAIGLALVAPVVYGAISLHLGWGPLPGGVWLKGGSIGGNLADNLRSPHLLLLLAAALCALLVARREGGTRWSRRTVLVTFFILVALQHVVLARIGWFFRYEAYLVFLGGCVLIPQLVEWRHRAGMTTGRALFIGLAVTASLALTWRGFRAARDTPRAMHDRYLEHISTADFVASLGSDSPIVLNDIGAVVYFTDSPILDCYGIGSAEPIRYSRKTDGYTCADLEAWARREGARAAILQTEWQAIASVIPSSWREIATWRLPRNVVFGDHTVGFFVINESDRAWLRSKLEAFSRHLPSAVRQTFVD